MTEGIIYRYRAGIPWRDLPPHFGPWQTVWKRHRRYSADGTWDKALASLLARADTAGLINWEVSVDSTTIDRAKHSAASHPLKPCNDYCQSQKSPSLRRPVESAVPN
jgi:transposase